MADHVPAPLSKEVLPPQKPSSGFGIMMVASLAMFFAVASSAFVLRARMVRNCPTMNPPPEMVAPQARMEAAIPVSVLLAPPKIERECGTPEYRTNPDGSTTIFYEVCPKDGQDSLSPIRSAVPAIEVREIR